ncbi:MAG: zinc-ribbon domain-containing protein [Firmicutes bacterium]|nr:zinc-ribbon domain-containing protein [Bacillota bacterium]
MFCTKCGKRLYDGDSFCAHCGAKVREELLFKKEVKGAPRTTGYDEVVFNPPFKREAERRTQSIESEVANYSTTPTRERISFDWNLDGFPTNGKKADDDFEINWDAVIERKRESRAVNIEKIVPEFGFISEKPEKKETTVVDDNLFKSPIIEELEKKIEIVVDDKKEEPELVLEPLVEEPAEDVVEEVDLFKTEEEDKPLTIEELERALFGTEDFEEVSPEQLDMTIEYKSIKTPKKQEEFYTFNEKRDAFQELVDKEKARIEALENERQNQWQEIAPVEEKTEYVPKEVPTFEEVFIEPKTPLVPPLREVAVALPPLTAKVMAYEEELEEPVVEVEVEDKNEVEFVAVALPPLTARVVIEEEPKVVAEEEPKVVVEKITPTEVEETEACPFQGEVTPEPSREVEPEPSEETKEKTKLRYSDVFPVGSFDFVDDDKSNKSAKEEIDDDDDDEEEGQHKFIKAIIILLAIVVLLEIAIIGVKFLVPNSKVAMLVDDVMNKVTSFFVDDEGDVPPEINIEETLSEKYINMLSGDLKNVGTVKYDATLKYDTEKHGAFDEISETNQFQDVAWNGDSEKTNGYHIIESVISYYDGWSETNEDSNIVGINQVEIGEIRTGNSGYYVLNKIVYAEAAGDVIEKTESVYLEASGDRIMVKEVKEETK